MAQDWTSSTSNRRASSRASECLERIRSEASATAFGYKIQAIAAHVLLRLDYRIVKVNRTGHPDIVSTKNGKEFRFEIEAEVVGPRTRKLTGRILVA